MAELSPRPNLRPFERRAPAAAGGIRPFSRRRAVSCVRVASFDVEGAYIRPLTVRLTPSPCGPVAVSAHECPGGSGCRRLPAEPFGGWNPRIYSVARLHRVN